MDVRCNRCATEYDFDDALISERGTTVKCTNCGYQFKVFPPDASLVAPERWVVRTATGEELVYLSLRELQRGITEQQVGANDLLSRGKQPPRPLGSIAELEQFFTAPGSYGRLDRTLLGVAPGGSGQAPVQPPRPVPPEPPEPPFAPEPPEPPSAPSSEGNATHGALHQRTTNPFGSLAVGAATPVAASSVNFAAPTPSPGSIPRSPSSPALGRGSQPELGAPLGQLPDLRATARAAAASSTLPPSRRDLRSYEELALDPLPDPRRRARSRWIAAVVVAGIATLLVFTVGKRYILEMRAPSSEPVQGGSARVTALLKDGIRLLDEGQLDEAGEQLTRATALSDKDPHVLAALARLSVLRADVSWLKLRLLDPKLDELAVQATQRELGRAVGKAQSAVKAAFAVAPENIVVLRARVDALRLSGDRDSAREWLEPIASNPADPANAYVLAALDLAEDSPVFSSVVLRLKTAASGEPKPSRAHVALVYALARAGRLADAEAELKKFESNATSLPLIDELTTFVTRARAGGALAPESPAKPTPPPQEAPKVSAAERATPPSNAAPTDFRKLLELASRAMARGDYAQAERLYEGVLEQRPGNTEALSGLGDVARRRNDPERAARLYDQVLAENPNYVPALLASADQKWNKGDHAAAITLYRRVLDHTGPNTSYGKRAAARIAEHGSDSDRASGPNPVKGISEEPDDPYSDAPPRNPDIDTTDLPTK